MERYEWVFIKKPELTKAVPRSPRQRSSSLSSPTDISSSPNGHVASSNHLSVPVLQRGKVRLSPFLAIRHFLLPSKTASMFMSGTQEGIIIGNHAINKYPHILRKESAILAQKHSSPNSNLHMSTQRVVWYWTASRCFLWMLQRTQGEGMRENYP